MSPPVLAEERSSPPPLGDSAVRPPQAGGSSSSTSARGDAAPTEPPVITLGEPLELCPIPASEIAAAVDAQPHLSTAQIVQLITTRVHMDDRSRALLVAMVDGAVAGHRCLAERVSAVINTAATQDPAWIPLLSSRPILQQLAVMIQSKLTSAVNRPY